MGLSVFGFKAEEINQWQLEKYYPAAGVFWVLSPYPGQVARGGRAIMLAPHFTCESRAQLPRRPELHHSHSRPQLVEQAWQGQMRM